MKHISKNDSDNVFQDALEDTDNFSTDVYYGMSFGRLNGDAVLSRALGGTQVCRLEDDEWYLRDFAFSVSDNIYFNYLPFYEVDNHDKNDIELCKKIFIMKMFATNPKTGRALRATTMQETYRLLLKLNRECALRGISIAKVFSSFETYTTIQDTLPKSMYRSLLSLVRTLHRITAKERGFILNAKIFSHITTVTRIARKNSQQYPIIPSRILLAKYIQYNEYLDDYLQHHVSIKKLLKSGAENPYLGKSKYVYLKSRNSSRYNSPEQLAAHILEPKIFADTIQVYDLGPLQKKYGWSSMSNVTSFLNLTMYCARQLIHLFTMMRDHEVKSLRVGCLEPVKGWNNEALYVVGVTTKLQGKPKPSKWITNDSILKPVEVLEHINSVLSPHAKSEKSSLFISTALHPVSNAVPGKVTELVLANPRDRLPPVYITDEDIKELELIDPFRNWRSDKKFKIGAEWKVSSHQFRRSMAVFAGQSGLISLPALKRALGHLTKIMTLYYTRGCSAGNYMFGFMNPELSKELKSAKQEADGAIFIRDALETTERLFGIRGKTFSEDKLSYVFLQHLEEESHRRVKLGLMALTETPVGWCASVARCDKRAHANFFSCPGCRHLIGSASVMEETLAIMEFDLAELDSDSIEYRAEKQNIADFVELRDRITFKG